VPSFVAGGQVRRAQHIVHSRSPCILEAT
jgi:hypothetical protein